MYISFVMVIPAPVPPPGAAGGGAVNPGGAAAAAAAGAARAAASPEATCGGGMACCGICSPNLDRFLPPSAAESFSTDDDLPRKLWIDCANCVINRQLMLKIKINLQIFS